MITPVDIQNVVFDKTFRGYVPEQVENFLNEISSEYEELYRENIKLRDEIKSLKKQLSNYNDLENTLKDTLVIAKSTSDELIESAKEKAKIILEEAEMQAIKEREASELRIKEVDKKYDDVILSYNRFKNRYRSFLESNLLSLEELNLIED